MFGEDPENDEHGRRKSVWCCGDKCEVRWSVDGEVYKATVRKILRTKGGRKAALVRFDGYGSEDEEEVNLDELMTIQRAKSRRNKSPASRERPADEDALLSALRVDESQRLREKFEMRDKEEELENLQSTPARQSWKTTSKHLVQDDHLLSKQRPASRKPPSRDPQKKSDKRKGAKGTPETPKPSIMKKEEPSLRKTPLKIQFTDSESDDEKPAHTKNNHSGFDDEDLEKPRFPQRRGSTKEPLVLSEEGDEPKVCIPATINQYLWDYQRDGVRFLYRHYRNGGGAILGDDMGLGKTVQVIAFLSALLRKTGTKEDVFRQRPKFIRKMSSEYYEEDEGEKKIFLIIGPATVLYNWVDELETWGYFAVGKFHKQHKEQTLADLKKEKLDIVVTTFETCRDNVDVLNRFEWEAVIADEAHKIKGMKAELTQALKALRCKRRFGLTGTALQNDMKELWCILDWANPGCLGSVGEFQEKFEKVILDGQKQDATKRQLAYARKAKETFSELRSQWFIRRTKALIADQLPKKEEQVVYCRPTSFQVDVYKAILGHPHIRFILTRNDPCPCKSGRQRGKCHYKKADDGRSVNQLLFSYLQVLLKTANHVALLMPEYAKNANQRRQADDICSTAFARHPQFREQTRVAAFRTLSDPKYCGKMKVMAGLLKVFKKEKCKVLLFSLSTQLLDIIEHYVVTTGYEYRRLDGKTPDMRRMQLVREFNSDPGIFLFLASTRAGGVGLNLTGANVVMIYDPNWNPTHDLQAQDRAYRVGQGRDVRVFRLITMGTIEENIYLRQVYKQQLDRVAVSEENAKRLFHRDEIFGLENLFKLRTSESCLTKDIMERNAKIETGLKGFNIQKYIPAKPAEDDKEDLLRSEIRSSRGRVDKDQAVDYLCNEEGSSDDEENDAAYGEEEVEGAADSDGSTTNDSETPTKPKTRRKRAAPLSDSSDDLMCGQRQRASSKRGHGDAACLECLNPSPGTSSDTKRHTCGRRIVKRDDTPRSGTARSSPKDHTKESGERAPERRPSTMSEPTATLHSVSDVFEQYGVTHRHENRKLVGASRAEDHMTRCAIQDVYELHQHSQAPAAYCQPLSESSEESDDLGTKHRSPEKEVKTETKKKKKLKKAETKFPRAAVIGSDKVLIGQTPLAIRKQQFKEMTAAFGEKDILALSRRVLKSSPATLDALLRHFYTDKYPSLEEVFTDEDEKRSSEKESDPKRSSKSKDKRGRCRRKQKSGERGVEYSSDSGTEDQGETSQSDKPQRRTSRHQRRVRRESDQPEDRDKRDSETNKELNKPNDTYTDTLSNPVDKLLEEMLGNDGDGEEKRKSAPRTPKKLAKKIVGNAKDKDSEPDHGNVPNTNRSIIDDLFDTDEEAEERRRRRSPTKRTAKPTSKKKEAADVSPRGAVLETPRAKRVLDGLFDDDDDDDDDSMAVRKAAPKRKVGMMAERTHSDSDDVSESTRGGESQAKPSSHKPTKRRQPRSDSDSEDLSASTRGGQTRAKPSPHKPTQRKQPHVYSDSEDVSESTRGGQAQAKLSPHKQTKRSRQPRIDSDSEDVSVSTRGGEIQAKPSPHKQTKRSRQPHIDSDSEDVSVYTRGGETQAKPSSYKPTKRRQPRVYSDSDDELFSGVSPAKRGKESQGEIGETSLDLFSRECKVKTPLLNATVDDSFLDSDSDDEFFSNTRKWKKRTRKI